MEEAGVASTQTSDQIMHCKLERIRVLGRKDTVSFCAGLLRPVCPVVRGIEIIFDDLLSGLIEYLSPLLVREARWFVERLFSCHLQLP